MIDAVLIRPAREHERALLSELAMRSKASWGYSHELLDAFRDELTVTAEQLPLTFVAEEEAEIVGFYTLASLSEDRAELYFLFVEPSSLRRGYGTALIEHAKEHARRMGSRCLEIQGDPNAARFYTTRAGAIEVGQRESDSVPGRMLPLYELPLERGSGTGS